MSYLRCVTFAAAVALVCGVPAPMLAPLPDANVNVGDAWTMAARAVDHCSTVEAADMAVCLGIKAATTMERLARSGNIAVLDGALTLVRTEAVRDARNLPTEAELQSGLPADSASRNARVVDLVLDAAARLAETHSLQLKMPKFEASSVARALEEGRGKMKKMMGPILAGLALKLLAVVPIVIGFLGVVAVKALIIAKIAFVIAAVLAAQKLISSSSSSAASGWSAGSTAGWSSGSAAPSSGGYYSRSLDASAASAAHDLAYSAHAPDTN